MEIQSAKQALSLGAIRVERFLGPRSISGYEAGSEPTPTVPSVIIGQQQSCSGRAKMTRRKRSIEKLLSAFPHQAHATERIEKHLPSHCMATKMSRRRSRIYF